jgi:acetolactate synthase-1/2/3 large subunit
MTTSSASYYRPPQKLSVAQGLLEYLKIEGATTLFGVPGGALTHLLNELKNQRDTFTYVVCRQETGAVFMADGYARATGKLGVALVTSGPGACNALTGTMNAQNSNTNVLTITGEVPEKSWGRGYLQEGIDANLNIDAIYRNASQYSAVITSPDNFQTLFTQALRDALSRPPRAAHVSVPLDVAGQCLPKDAVFPSSPENYRATPCCSDHKGTLEALEMLARARRPLLFLGNGCRRALADPDHPKRLADLKDFVTRFALPVVTTPEAKGIFPETDLFSLRNYGLAACLWPQDYLLPTSNAEHYDALLVVGSSLQEHATSSWNAILTPHGPFFQVDLDQAVIGRAFPVQRGIVAETGVFLDDLIHLSADVQPDDKLVQARKALLKQIKKSSPHHKPKTRKASPRTILPQELMGCINDTLKILKEKRRYPRIFLDGGNCLGWGYHYLEIDPPTELHSALDMGPMGFGVAGVVGAKLGDRERDCVTITGDGALLMQGAEISTAAQHRLGAIWIVLNDNDLAMVSQGMNYFFPDPTVWKHYYSIGKPDLVQFAQALGADAYNVYRPAGMLKTFLEALDKARRKRKPQVIVAHIDTREMPPYYPPEPPPYVPCDQQP